MRNAADRAGTRGVDQDAQPGVVGDATGDAGSGETVRIAGLDAWRTVLILGGILVHATHPREPNMAFDIVVFVSAMFRMGAFFAISGMLAGLSLTRVPATRWWRTRMTQIGIPTLFGLIVISPLTTLMLRATPGALHIGSRFLDWYHLWFLFALLIYTPIVAMVDRADARRGWFARFDAAAQSDRAIELGVLLILPLASLIAMAILIRATAAFTADSMPALMHSSFIAGYAPLYALGFALARSARLRDALLGRRTVAPVILIAFAVVCVPLQFGDVAVGAMQSSMRVWMRLIAGAFCAPAATLVILRSAFAIDRVSPLFRRVARAGLTIYIVHFPIAVALNVAFAYVEAPVVLEYLVVVGLTTALACLIHIRIVDRWPVAALLLNGRRRRPAPRPVAVPEAAIPVPPSPSAATHG